MRYLRTLLNQLLPPIGAFIALMIAWSGAKYAFSVQDFFVPYPWSVLTAGYRIQSELLQATMLTGQAAVGGFSLSVFFGTILAVLFAQFRVLRLGCFPYAVILQTVPIVAIAPLITYAYGAGFRSVVLISFIVSLFPIIANMMAGLTSVPRGMRELFLLNRATRLQTIMRLQIPHALPDLFTGMRTSGGLAVIGAIVGEFFAGNSSDGYGLGFMVPQRISQFKADEAFVAP